MGESGSGKSTFGRSLLRLTPITDGHVGFDGTDVGGLDRNALKSLRRRMQMIFQDPYASLNPRMTVYDTLAEPLLLHKIVDRGVLMRPLGNLWTTWAWREDLPRNTHTNSQVVNDSALPSAGTGNQTRVHCRRRAGLGPRCHYSGTDPRPAKRPEGRVRADHAICLARSCCHPANCRPCSGALSRKTRGSGQYERCIQLASKRLHPALTGRNTGKISRLTQYNWRMTRVSYAERP